LSQPGNTELDEATVVLGLPKHGKTTFARRDAIEFLRAHPTGLVLAHDINQQFGDFCRMYENTEQWRRAYRDATTKREPFPRGASFQCEASEIGELVLELGRRHNRALSVRVPMKYIKDEESLSDTSEPTYQGPQDRVIWSNRRHLGVAPLLNGQLATDINEKFYKAATKVVIFAQGEEAARYLERKLSVSKGALDPIVSSPPARVAPRFKFLLWRQGEGIVTQ